MLQNNIDINVVTNQLSDILVEAAKKTFEIRKVKNNVENGKPWFDNDCRKSKREYNRARNRYKRFRCDENFTVLKEKNKMCKRSINRSFKKYQQEFLMFTKCQEFLIFTKYKKFLIFSKKRQPSLSLKRKRKRKAMLATRRRLKRHQRKQTKPTANGPDHEISPSSPHSS